MGFKNIILEKRDNVATLTFNRPRRANSVNWEMTEEIDRALAEIRSDNDIRVMVLTGAGRIFCGGGDIDSEMNYLDQGPEAVRETITSLPLKVTVDLHHLEIPTIAMINGPCVGGGVEWACACDLRIGSEKAKFMCAQIRVGVFPDTGGCYFFPRVMGLGKALEFMFTGDYMEAEEAAKVGLLTRLVPSADLEAETMDLARKLAKGPPMALKLAKLVTYRSLRMDLETSLQAAGAFQAITMKSEDHREGLVAFKEKREPVYKGK